MHKRLLLLTLTALPALGFEEPTRQKLTVRVVDHASIPPATLRRATLEAEAIFRRSGLETQWLPCLPEECGRSVPDSQLVIRILAPSMEGHKTSRHRLGIAIPTESRVYIFYSDVESSRLAHEYSVPVLLASVMAHEAAHLLGLEHSDIGIMHGGFTAKEIEQAAVGLMRFDETQAIRLRTEIQARLEQGQAFASAAPNPVSYSTRWP
jgi:hypothetical protein